MVVKKWGFVGSGICRLIVKTHLILDKGYSPAVRDGQDSGLGFLMIININKTMLHCFLNVAIF